MTWRTWSGSQFSEEGAVTWKIHFWPEGDYVKVQFDLEGGTNGSIRGMGEPTHTRTRACAGILTLYPEAWDQLRSTLLAGLYPIEGVPASMGDLTITRGKP